MKKKVKERRAVGSQDSVDEKRKAVDEFESSLSPMPEEDEDEDAEMAGSDEAGTVKRGKALDGASARRGPRTGRDHDGKVSAAEDLQRVRRYKW